ncbi:MAG: FAD assembly factor SdhE [Rhodospirillales bacterium]
MDDRRKRLIYRWSHRGMKEVDALVGGFVAAGAQGFSEADLRAFEALLEAPDNDVLAWAVGREAAPAAYDCPAMRRLTAKAAP